MNVLMRGLITLSLLFFSSIIFAEIVTPSQNFPLQNSLTPPPGQMQNQALEKAKADTRSTGFMLFQVIKDQMVLDYSNLHSASIIETGGHYKGLLVQLKKPFVSEMEGITSAGMGRPANLVFNKKIISTTLIQSPLGGSVLITGLSKEDAQLFLASLNRQKRPLG